MSFLTGSRVYGTPHDKSDYDLVVLVTEAELALLIAASGETSAPVDLKDYDGIGAVALRFGKLNLLCETDERAYDDWRTGTDELLAEAPVIRARAVAVFDRLRGARRAEREEAAKPKTSTAYAFMEF